MPPQPLNSLSDMSRKLMATLINVKVDLSLYALDLLGRAFVAAGEHHALLPATATDGEHAQRALLVGARPTQAARARLDMVRGWQLTHPVADTHQPVGSP